MKQSYWPLHVYTDLHLHRPLAYRSTAQIPFHCLLPSSFTSPLPLPYKNPQNLLSLPAKNFQFPNLPSLSRETNRNPKTLFPDLLTSTAQTKQQENRPEEKPQGSS